MRLESTFNDYYDAYFDGTGPVLCRHGGNGGPHKAEQFRILEEAGFQTPPHGTFEQIAGEWWDAEKRRISIVVAYLDPTAHCTEGKTLWSHGRFQTNPHMSGRDRYAEQKKTYCSAFLGNLGPPSCSIRRLQVGPHVFWIEYKSTESWMSNFGDGTIEVVGVEKDAGFHPVIKLPLWAADFVIGKELYAVDFNTAPGIRGSGVEKILSGKEVVEALHEALHRS